MSALPAIALAAAAALALVPSAGARPVSAASEARAPSVVGVDPPNWFVDYSRTQIQLLVRGDGLVGSVLESDDERLTIERQSVNADGRYLLAYARVAESATPGAVDLHISNGGESVPVPFELRARTPREGRFAGLTQDDVVYLVMPDRFANGDPANDEPAAPGTTFDRSEPHFYHGGDLRGLADRLPYLDDLGVTAIWLNPIYENVDAAQPFQPYHGYHTVDYYDVEDHLGTVADFRALVDAAHGRGIKVVQDQVANHTGPDHPWVESYPTPTWFNGTPGNHLVNPFDIPSIVFPDASQSARRATLEGWFVDLLPDLDQTDPDLAAYQIQNTLWWIETTGIDAIRQDTLPYVPRTFWSEWMAAIDTEYPSFTVVGEVFHGDPVVTSFFQGGVARWDGVDSKVDTVFDFPLFFAINDVMTRGDVTAVTRVLSADDLYVDPSILVTHVGNHDTQRIARTVGNSSKRLMLAQTLLFTLRGIPQLYYGDEIGMDGGGDPDNRRDFPGGWPGDARNAFTAEGRTKNENKVFNHVRRVLEVRAASPALRGTGITFLGVVGGTFTYLRDGSGQKALVVLNLSSSQQTVNVPVRQLLDDGTRLRDAIASKIKARVRNGRVSVKVPANTSAILLPE